MPASWHEGRCRVASLVRVSTTHLEQADSPLHQLGYLREEMKRSGWTDSGLVYQAELTGAVILDRPDIQRMIADARAGCFEAILLKSISRLGRDTLGLLMVKRYLDDLGVELIALSDGYRSFRDPELIFLVHAERAQAGRQEIAKNVRAGVTQAARRGIWPAGTLPFGYLRQSRLTVAIDPATAPVLRQIFAMRREGRGVVAICRHLNRAARVKAPRWWQLGEQIRRLEASDTAGADERVQERLCRLRRERETGAFLWHPRTVRLILSNTAYYGELRYNRTSGERRMHGRLVRLPRKPDDWITLHCPPLVSREEWEQVQQVGEESGRLPRRSRSSRFLLSGLAICGCCGSALRGVGARPGAGRRGGDPLGYYVCRAAVEAGAHSPAYVRAAELEQAVLERLRALLAPLSALPGQKPGRRAGRRSLRMGPESLAAACGLLGQWEEGLQRSLADCPCLDPAAPGLTPEEWQRRLMRLDGDRETTRLLLSTLVERVVLQTPGLVELRLQFTAGELAEAAAPGPAGRRRDSHTDSMARPTTP